MQSLFQERSEYDSEFDTLSYMLMRVISYCCQEDQREISRLYEKLEELVNEYFRIGISFYGMELTIQLNDQEINEFIQNLGIQHKKF